MFKEALTHLLKKEHNKNMRENVQKVKASLSAELAVLSRVYSPVRLGGRVQLAGGRIHEVMGDGADMFAVLAAAKHEGDVVWIGLGRDLETLAPTGLENFIDPARIVIVEGVSRTEILWAAEQALSAEGGACVVLEMPSTLGLKESQRLQHAAEQGGALGLVILHAGAATSAAQTRWDCRAQGGAQHDWRWSCVKGKNGEAGEWYVRYQERPDAEDTLFMAATTAA